MKEKLISPDGAITLNLKKIAKEQSELLELRQMELSDLADEALLGLKDVLNSDIGIYEVLCEISENVNLGSPDEDASDKTWFSGIVKRCAEDKAYFSEYLAKRISTLGVKEQDFFDLSEHRPTVTYVKNPYADEAYDVFSVELDDARVKYSRDFAECTKLLYNKEVSYCLFPLEEKGGTRLPTIGEIIYRNDLKINSITPVFGPDNSLDLKYALVSNHLTVPDKTEEDDRYLEIRIPKSESVYLSDLLFAAELFGHTVYRVDTQSFQEEESTEMFFNVVVRDNNELFLALLVYITLFVDEYNLIGMYKNLE